MESLGSQLVADHDTFLFDCDGVLWRGHDAVPGVAEALAHLRSLGKRIYFVTNNASKSREQNTKSIQHRGFQAEVGEVMCTAPMVPLYLNRIGYDKSIPVFAISAGGIAEELTAAGFHVKTTSSEGCGCVAVGYDDGFTYHKLAQASLAIQAGALFIATNEDATFPSGNHLLPGAGSLVAAVSTASGKSPVVLGKPHSMMMDVIREECGASWNAASVIMIGMFFSFLFFLLFLRSRSTVHVCFVKNCNSLIQLSV
jgi:HAD superfamily hydrolase (TIGR01450 family)